MTSAQKIKANRTNAQASSGPKTARGKARATRNARRHGLSLSVILDLALSEHVEAFARAIAADTTDANISQLARRVAEAQVDLQRVRYARHQLVSNQMSDPDYQSRASMTVKLALLRGLLKPNAADMSVEELASILESDVPQGSSRLATIFSDEAPQLRAIERYERRALSRRKFAIRALDLARQQDNH